MYPISRWLPLVILIPYFVMIACGLMMPSDGYHGAKSPKSLSFLATSYLIFIYFFYKNRFTSYQYKLLAFTLFSVAFLLFWFLIGAINQFDTGVHATFDQFKIFMITIVFTVVTLYIVSEKIIRAETLIKGVIYTNLTYSILKISCVVLSFMGILKLSSFIEKMGIRVMTMTITTDISRVQTSVDIITPFLIYFVLQSKPLNLNFGRIFRLSFFLISLISIALSFSRFLLAVGFLSALFYWFTLSLPRFTKGLIFFCIALWGGVMMIGVDETAKIITRRFDSRDSFASDQVREEQISALMREYENYQIVGKGLGGSTDKYIRDGDITHSYEVQWVAFLMQFGAFGILFLLIPVLYISNRFLTRPTNRVQIGFLLLFFIWLLSGFTNPYLISLTSGIVYSTFLLAADILSRNKTPIPLKNR